MDNGYVFRKVKRQEIPLVFALIMRRVAWMDRVGIHQWNDTNYAARYPLHYYEHRRQQEELFLLEESATGRMVCVGALFHEDERWPDRESAFYLHHLASDVDARGTGSIFLEKAEEYCIKQGKKYLRLDSAVGNQNLEEYYTSRGYVEAGECVDGLYRGILRQKKLI